MVKITNGREIVSVPYSAYKSIYSSLGFVQVQDEAANSNNEDLEADERTEEEKFVDSIMEKPISEWVASEVKRFAKIKGIDISGTKNANEAKDIISKEIGK